MSLRHQARRTAAATCSTAGGEMGFSGCSTVPTCSVSASTSIGYATASGWDTTSGRLRADQCTATGDS
eukprot:2172191-Alexandrium_andersonii.AAC.1